MRGAFAGLILALVAGASGYRVGDKVDPETTVFTAGMEPRTLSEIVERDSEVVVLILIGGAAPSAPSYHPLRGGLWCPDSFDELPVYRTLMRTFRGDPVQFVAVAAPPAYSNIYGFQKDVFVKRPADDPEFQSAARTFIDLTEETKQSGVMPFQTLYYDPKYRLLHDHDREFGPGYGEIRDWQGRLRWRGDRRKYGTPTVWILNGELEVLRKPFIANNYNAETPQVRYEYSDLKAAIEKALR